MAVSKEELTERAQILRAYEACCGIHFPTPLDLNFRIAVTKKLGLGFSLREMRSVEVTGPFQTNSPPASETPGPVGTPAGRSRR